MSVALRARTLQPLDVIDSAGASIQIPAGTEVVVVDYQGLGTRFGSWVFQYEGCTYSDAPHDALEILHGSDATKAFELPPPGGLTFAEVLGDFLVQEGAGEHPSWVHSFSSTAEAAASGSPVSWGEPGEGRPTLDEINAFLAEKELQSRNAGTMSREEFLRRKEVLMARIRRHEEGL